MKNIVKGFIFAILFLFTSLDANCQPCVVKSFRRVNEAVRSNNNPSFFNDPLTPKGTLIRVLTDQPGFDFDFGPIGNIIPTDQREGMRYFIIPLGAESITITNKQYGIRCKYLFGKALDEWIYEMVLNADSLMPRVQDSLKTKWISIRSFPWSAKIYIDDFAAGVTPYDGSLTLGRHKVKIVNNGEKVERNINVTQDDMLPVRMVFEAEDYKKSASNNSDNLKSINIEQYPEYPVSDGFQKFIEENMQNPAVIWDENCQGTVFVQCIISETGRISNVKVIRGIGGRCDEEAVLLVKMMPNWIPARANGKAVPCVFMIPIKFHLQ
jgi:TonB family protein